MKPNYSWDEVSRPFFSLAVRFFVSEQDKKHFGSSLGGGRRVEDIVRVEDRNSWDFPSTRGCVSEWVSATLIVGDLISTFCAVVGLPWQQWIVSRVGGRSGLSQKAAFDCKLTLAQYARQICSSSPYQHQHTLVISFQDQPGDTAVVIERKFEKTTAMASLAKRQARGTPASSGAATPQSENLAGLLADLGRDKVTKRKGKGSAQFHTQVRKNNVRGDVLWKGQGHYEGAHIIPDKFEGEAHAPVFLLPEMGPRAPAV